ncbi:hypothetical protein KYI13_12785 (plasmid) [Macrococcoides bohemicum]|uniref:hypothetical protein n=1 Tax=Macrococcoides bohemicum TaxID=1903056 RepID=UPI001C5D77FA|nr:hypothetical protein [Macrococcus bohemicus]QYA46057.1 hypothetical protein KYI13_12785 [Macrococcus bohemicus]
MATIIDKVFSELYEKYIKQNYSDFCIVSLILGIFFYFNIDNITFLREQKQLFNSKEIGNLELIYIVISIAVCVFLLQFFVQGILSYWSKPFERQELAVEYFLLSAKISYYSLPISIVIFDILLNKVINLANKPIEYDKSTGQQLIHSLTFIDTFLMIFSVISIFSALVIIFIEIVTGEKVKRVEVG